MASKTPAQDEFLAIKMVGDYITACQIDSADQLGNYLMKLCSVAGALMAQAEGSANAHDRLIGTAEFIKKTMPEKPGILVQIH